LRQEPRNFDFSELKVNWLTLDDKLLSFTADGVNFDEFKAGRAK
jgi:hypothetical protein